MNKYCYLCPHKCGIDRNFKTSFCHSSNTMRICRIAPHFYEEPPISGTNGSGAIFFSGCSLDCEFCQNYTISKYATGKHYTPEELAFELYKLEKMGVHNINFVTPTHFSHKIKETLDIYRPNIPIVYNTSGYELPEVVNDLLNYVDIFLFDMKYGNDVIAKKYSKCIDYTKYCKPSLEIAVQNKKLIYKNDLLIQGVIVRHLVLPTELNNSIEVIDYFSQKYKNSAILSVMSQFTPTYKSSIKRTLKPLEYKIIINKLLEYGIEDNCYIQDLTSAKEIYIPKFDVTP